MGLRAEFLAARRAVEEAQLRVRSLRAHPVNTRLAGRLEADVRRVVEDLDELAQETLSATRSHQVGVTSGWWWSQEPPVPVPSRLDEPEFHPECDDEGVGGGRQVGSRPPGPARRWRRPHP